MALGASEKANILPLAPEGTKPGAAAQITWRTYVNATANAPPTIIVNIDGVSKVLKPCAAPAPEAPIPSAPLPSFDNVTFLRYNDTDVQANGDTAYLFAPVKPPQGDTVLVIQGRSPRSPLGDSPSVWPTDDADVRYWSLCNSIMQAPYPVVVNKAGDVGCRHDSQFQLDEQHKYLAIVGTEAQRDVIQGIPNSTFIPFSVDYPDTNHGLIFRQMITADGFSEGVKRVPPGSSLDATVAIMGDYYPHASFCSLSSLKDNGPQACSL
ncbi:uncharacterized protein ColSpa_06147 [Colletotrichum spaethianum]|uniref:Uncharacterized protein n=1 Tax=Colletotrichum spaethianum TaxID=700344 RepID=A0AA37P6B0_9PEZI|nr:uncharacterized protein ColSpa_06147 [Colletotrichum spaethianum]GKT45966.1 hypothetical protein ColSpa_06147 [Colletotrichum spaethianum]